MIVRLIRSSRKVGRILVILVPATGCDPGFSSRYEESLRQVFRDSSGSKACGDVRALLIPECPVESACFTPACEAHDQCYATCGAVRTACDIRFYADLVSICLDSIALEDPQLRGCLTWASIYWSAVDQFGQKAFDETQTLSNCVEDTAPVSPGACCRAGTSSVCEDAPDCPSPGVLIPGLTCEQVETFLGGCPVPGFDDCSARRRVCLQPAPEPDVGVCVGEFDGDGVGRVCSIASQDCFSGAPCLPVDGTAYRCKAEADNRLATTDGPPAGGACEESGVDSFQADVWLEYVAPCSGTLVIRMCEGTSYDSMLAVYGSSDASAECVCPTDNNSLLACDDDFCFGFDSPSSVNLPAAMEGACYLIRVGGWSPDGISADRGVSQLDIGILCNSE